jgi:glycosyltransferase involved in cell wall biosynthesis
VTKNSTRGRLLVINWQDLANPLAGGAEVHLLENLTRLVRDGFEVTLLCSNFKGGEPDLEYEGIRILRRGGRFDFNWRVPGLVRELVRKEKFDLLIEDINKLPFYTPLYQPVPVLTVVPHLFATTVFQEIHFLLASYIYVCEYPVRWAYRGIPFCVISESTRDDLIERGFSESSIEVIHCGIDHDVYHVDPSVSKSEEPTILYLGRLKKYKSVQHLIAAFAKLVPRMPTARLVIVGDGDYRQALELLARKLGVSERVTFTGFISSDEKVHYLQRAWVAVCPSLKEGWGLTNIEANACGTVVVAANVPGLRDSVDHGTNGYLYPHGDISVLAQQLTTLLHEPASRKHLEQGAIEWARQFDWNHGAARWGELIDRTIAKGRARS